MQDRVIIFGSMIGF